MTQSNQQQQQAQQRQQQQRAQAQQQQQQQQPPSIGQMLGRSLTDIRKVQNWLELNYPNQGEAIRMQREAGDLIWAVIQRMQQQQQQQNQQ